jgi:hypothetical protein
MMPDVIVALTTWKGRIYDYAFIKVLYRLCGDQKTKFTYKVVLSLSEEEFPNKEHDLPEKVLLFTQLENFEILWSYANTKALKNYYPVQKKYQDLPIIVIGDDTIYSRNLVEYMMTEHLKDTTQALGNSLFYWDADHDEIPVLCQVRLFPPHCMVNLPEQYFIEDFNNLENDIFYGICLKLQRTPCRCLGNSSLVEKPGFFGQEKKLAFEYWKPENNPQKLYEEFLKKHPDLAEKIKG